MNNLQVIKVGTAVASNAERTALDFEAINAIGQEITNTDIQTVLVSSGAVAAGIDRLGWTRDEVDRNMDHMRVASMVGNSALFVAWEHATGRIVAPDLPTSNDLDSEEAWLHLEQAIRCALKLDLQVVLNEGDARSSEELETMLKVNGKDFKRFGDNDWLAAHTAVQLSADSLTFLTDRNGVLSDHTDLLSTINHIRLDEIDDFVSAGINDESASNGGMSSKLLAAKFALENGVKEVLIRNGNDLSATTTLLTK